jgi:hypothetical protein
VERLASAINPAARAEFEPALKAYEASVHALQARAAKDAYPGG